MDTDKGQKFWADNLCALFTPKGLTIIPTPSMTQNEKLNALTRLVIIIAVVMYLLDYEYWLTFLVLGILVIFILKHISDRTSKKEGYRSPFFIPSDCQPMNDVSPILGSYWQTPPSIYNNVSLIPTPADADKCLYDEEEFCCGSKYPVFGQYVVGNSSKLLPYNSQEIANMPLDDAKLTMNANFDRDQIQYRNDMVKTFVNTQERWYRDSCGQAVSPLSQCY